MLYHNNGGKVWWVMFRDPKRKGKFIRKSTGTDELAKARKIEQAEALAIRGAIDRKTIEGILESIYGVDHDDGSMTFADAWTLYEKVLKQRGREQSEKTKAQVKRNLDDFIDWAVDVRGLKRVREVTSEIALDYAEKLRRAGLKDKSRKNYIGNISSVWRVLSGIEQAIGNPWTNYTPTVKDAVRHGVFTVEQEAAILKAARECDDPTWEVLCLIARHTGLRKGDVVHLKYGQVNFRVGVIELQPSKTKRYGIAVRLPMVEALRKALKQWVAHRPAGSNGKVAAWKNEDWLFPEYVRTYPNDPLVTFREILEAAGIKDKTLTFHSYRHTCGAPDDLTKRLGGWTQDKTLARYDHADKTEEIRAMIEKAAGGK